MDVHKVEDACELCDHWLPVFLTMHELDPAWVWTIAPVMNKLVNAYGPPDSCGYAVWCGRVLARFARQAGLL